MLPTRSQFLIHFGKHQEFFISPSVRDQSSAPRLDDNFSYQTLRLSFGD